MSHLKSKKIIPLLIDQFKDHHILRALFGIKKSPTTPPKVEIKEELKIRDHHKSRRCSVILFTDQLRGHQRFLTSCGKESTPWDDPEDYQVLMGNERRDSSIPVTDQLRGHQRFLSPCGTSISYRDPKDYQVLIGNEERTSSVPVTDQLRGHQRFLSPCSTSISCTDPKDYQVLIGNEERISLFPVTDHLRNHQRFLSPCESRKATEVSAEDLPAPHLESQLSQSHQG